MAKQLLLLSFSKELSSEPTIYRLGHDYKVAVNLRKGSFGEKGGWVVLELDGGNEEIERAIEYLKSKGTQLEVIKKGLLI